MKPLRIGIVGIGNISGIYLTNLTSYRSTEVVALADLDASRAEAAAKKYGIKAVLTPDELIASDEVDLVLNLTVPMAHGQLALEAVRAGKHVYNEKPLCTTLAEARTLLDEAASRGVRVGCAPDTFLGAGLQTCREAIDKGLIGEPVSITGAMLSRGPEPWHPSPHFFYQRGGGPMLDMGPYYLTAFVSLLGGVSRISGLVRKSFASRPIPLTNENFYGKGHSEKVPKEIEVNTPTHIAGVLEFVSGPIGELVTSFDVYGDWASHPITIYGSEGTMKVPDPNTFDGDVMIRRSPEKDWEKVPSKHGFSENSRGIGVLDIADAIPENRPHRASGDLAMHVLEMMVGFEQSSVDGKAIVLPHPAQRPAPLAHNEFEQELADAVR